MDPEKNIDESWKESASQEKQTIDQKNEGSEEGMAGIEINFLNYITSLGFQALIFMGEIPNPITNESEKNLNQARIIIDTLIMLKEKTNGNLNDQENNLLEASIYDLQMKFIEIMKKEEGGESPIIGEKNE